MKIALIIAVVLALTLILPGPRESIVEFSSGLWSKIFSTMRDRSTISAEARKEQILRQTQTLVPAQEPNPLRAVSQELKGIRAGNR